MLPGAVISPCPGRQELLWVPGWSTLSGFRSRLADKRLSCKPSFMCLAAATFTHNQMQPIQSKHFCNWWPLTCPVSRCFMPQPAPPDKSSTYLGMLCVAGTTLYRCTGHRIHEKRLHGYLGQFQLTGELYSLAALPEFHSACRIICDDIVKLWQGCQAV